MFLTKKYTDLSKLPKFELQHQVLRRIVRMLGSVKALMTYINVILKKAGDEAISREYLNVAKNNDREFRYDLAIILHEHFGVPLEHLAPFAMAANHLLNNRVFQCLISKIIISDCLHDPMGIIQAIVLIDADNRLISGRAPLNFYIAQNKKKIPSIRVDFKRLLAALKSPSRYRLLSLITLIEFDVAFVISQKAAISLAFEQLIKTQSIPAFDSRTQTLIANIFGFDSYESMILAQKIYLYAPEHLIEAVNRGEVSIQTAVESLKLPQTIPACEQPLESPKGFIECVNFKP